MENKVFTVSILGCGSRGHYAYGRCMVEHFSDKFKIVSICDIDQKKIDLAKADWGIADEQCFLSSEEYFSFQSSKSRF